MALTVVTAATTALVDIEHLKDVLRIDADDRVEQLTAMLAGVTARLEAATQRRFLTQTLDWSLNDWSGCLRVPVAPVASVTSVKYRDVDGVLQTLAADQYVVFNEGVATCIRPILGATWPNLDPDAASPVVVRIVVGESAASSIVQQAAIAWMQMQYDNPTMAGIERAESGLPLTVEDLISGERWE